MSILSLTSILCLIGRNLDNTLSKEQHAAFRPLFKDLLRQLIDCENEHLLLQETIRSWKNECLHYMALFKKSEIEHNHELQSKCAFALFTLDLLRTCLRQDPEFFEKYMLNFARLIDEYRVQKPSYDNILAQLQDEMSKIFPLS